MNEKNKLIVIKFLENLLKDYGFQINVDISKGNDKLKIFKLKDLQEGNLGKIEKEEFENLTDIIDRLENYHKDYIYDTLKERINDKEVIDKNDLDYIAKRFIESNLICKTLQEITPQIYEEKNKKLDKVNVDDIKNVLEIEEEMYKNICQKYVETISNEMLIENNNEVLHFLIDDKFISLKDKGEINVDNYKNNLDDYDCIYRYNTYKELYEDEINQEICNDIQNEGLINENKVWKFYLTYEELKQINLEDKMRVYYPLIEKYILNKDNEDKFFKEFDLETLNEFEETLHLFYETNEIKYDKELGELYSDNCSFNIEILKLSEGLINYEDFIQDFTIDNLAVQSEEELEEF